MNSCSRNTDHRSKLSRAQGSLLGQLAGDALGSLVEFQSPKVIRRSYPDSVREPADGGWDVKKDGATRSSGHFDKKQDAIDAGRKISQNQGTEFYIHGKDGKIQHKDSHGNDPYPPKG